ncbi:hypothetical protein ABIE06_001335 [Pantoea dispersa]|jgi:hypothetical protein|nr:hypothetical protein [Pantoea dispersa]
MMSQPKAMSVNALTHIILFFLVINAIDVVYALMH